MSVAETFRKKLETQLDHWKAEIDALEAEAKAEEADAAFQDELYRRVDKLRAAYKNAEEKLAHFKKSSGDAVDDLKGAMERTWNDLSDSIKSARAKLES